VEIGTHGEIMIVRWLTHLYKALLYFYPATFRDEFADEMLDVFSHSAQEISTKSPVSLAALCWREFAGLPASILLIHHHVRSQQYPSYPHHEQLFSTFERSWHELAFALIVFLLPAGVILINQSPQARDSIGLLAVVLFLGVMIITGILGGTPLWSLPYAGIVLVIAGYLYLFQWVVNLVSPSLVGSVLPGPMDPGAYLLIRVASHGMLWLMLFCLTLLIVAALSVLNRFQPLLRRVRHDWTQLSYILYGESAFALLLLFQSQLIKPSYAVASVLFLAAGVWLFLRSQARARRILALLICLTLAVGIAALGNLPDFPSDRLWLLTDGYLAAPVRLLLSWAMMVAALLLPGLLARHPSKGVLLPPGNRLSR
jgi:hypothetical protein